MGCNIEPQIEINTYNCVEKMVNPKFNNERDPNFPDMEEWPGKKYKGKVIKRMKGYKCDLPINKLNDA